MCELLSKIGERRHLAIIIAMAAFFFIFLGMRIPHIKGDFHKPKQRPRAVVESVIKLKHLVCQQQAKQPHVTTIPTEAIATGTAPQHAATVMAPATQQVPPRNFLERSLPSRAPPALLS